MRNHCVAFLVCAVALFAFACSMLPAEDIQPAPVATNAKADTEILRRTPVIDGVVQAGEWDPFIEVHEGEMTATAYANWDENGLYVAAQSNKPVDLMITLDARNDGWFHGADNYLIKVTNAAATPTVTLERYDSKAKIQTPGATESLRSSALVCKSQVKPDSATVEIAVPASAVEGLKPAAAKSVGLRVSLRQAVEGAAWTPMSAMGDVETCAFAQSKAATSDQIRMSLALQDYKVVPGQKLEAKLVIKNKSAQAIPLQSFVIGGDGRAAPFLNSEKVRVEGLAPGDEIKHKFQSIIPSKMSIGSWALGAEARSESERIGAALASFEVVKPFELELDLGDEPFVIDSDKGHIARVKIKNQTPGRVLGEVTITIPEGWRIKPNLRVRQFEVKSEDQSADVRFRLSPPAGAKPGDATVKVDIVVNGEKYSLSKSLTLLGGGK